MIEKFNDLLGHTLLSAEHKQDEFGYDSLIFSADDGETYKLYHSRDCCERVTIEDINGDLADLVGFPLMQCEEVISEENLYSTWTFYKMATQKGYVTIRWHGESNGYYSVSVDFVNVNSKWA